MICEVGSFFNILWQLKNSDVWPDADERTSSEQLEVVMYHEFSAMLSTFSKISYTFHPNGSANPETWQTKEKEDKNISGISKQ